MITTALFDIDGVLNIGPRADYSRIGIDPQQMGEFWKRFLAECLVDTTDTKQLAASYFKQWGYTGTVDDFFTHWHTAEEGLVEGAINAVKQLKNRGVKVYSATNQDKYRLEYLRTQMGFGELFDTMYGSCNVGYAKPNPQFYTEILTKLNVDASEVVYFDDHQINVDAASSLGITSFFVDDVNVLIEQIGNL
jgi:putative hydrolase of the HAD superfamily